MPVQNTTKPISIHLTRPIDKRPKAQEHDLHGITFQYHKVTLPDKQMTLSISVIPSSSDMDMFAVYVSYGMNETLLEPPTESKFDILFLLPNDTVLTSAANVNVEDEEELRHTIFMPPNIHFGNGTYIFGVKLISKSFFEKENLLFVT